MRRIRFHYDGGWAGTDGYEDDLVEDDTTEKQLLDQAQGIMELALPERDCWYEEIAGDDDDWDGA